MPIIDLPHPLGRELQMKQGKYYVPFNSLISTSFMQDSTLLTRLKQSIHLFMQKIPQQTFFIRITRSQLYLPAFLDFLWSLRLYAPRLELYLDAQEAATTVIPNYFSASDNRAYLRGKLLCLRKLGFTVTLIELGHKEHAYLNHSHWLKAVDRLAYSPSTSRDRAYFSLWNELCAKHGIPLLQMEEEQETII